MALTNLNLTGKNPPRSLEPTPCLKGSEALSSRTIPSLSGLAWPDNFPSHCTLRKRRTDEIPVPLKKIKTTTTAPRFSVNKEKKTSPNPPRSESSCDSSEGSVWPLKLGFSMAAADEWAGKAFKFKTFFFF